MSSLINFCGFETGDFTECLSVSGTASIQTTIKRTGSYAARVNPTGTGTGSFSIVGYTASGAKDLFNESTIFAKFYFRYATKPSVGGEQIFFAYGTTTSKLSLYLNSDGKLLVYDANLTLIATSTKVLSADTWYRIEVKVTTGSNSPWALLIDGVQELSGSNDLSTENARYLFFGKDSDAGGNSVDYYYDDTSIATDQYPGASEVRALKPNDNGTFTDWVGIYTDVDELPHDSDTTYINSSTNTNVETVNLEDSSTVGITSDGINSVKSHIVGRRTGLVVNAKVRLRSGSTNNDTSGADLDTVYDSFGKIYNTDPNTTTPWLRSSVDSIQMGIIHNQSQVREARCTSILAMVDSVTYVTGIISPNVIGALSVNTKNIVIGLLSLNQSSQITVNTGNLYDNKTTLNEVTTLGVKADNVLIGQGAFNGIFTLTSLALPIFDNIFSLSSTYSLTVQAQNDYIGQVSLNAIFNLTANAVSEVTSIFSSSITLNVNTSLDITGQVSSNVSGQLTCSSTPIRSTSSIFNSTTSLGIIAEKVLNGNIQLNKISSLTIKPSNLIGQSLNISANGSVTIRSQPLFSGQNTVHSSSSLTINAQNFLSGSINTNLVGSLVTGSNNDWSGRLLANIVTSLTPYGTYNILAKSSLSTSSSLAGKFLTEIGVLQYIEKTFYINKVYKANLKIGPKRV